jgi:succinoglycan biosynthesis protein ExoM
MDHISVCVCTFKRAELLARGLSGIAQLETDGLFDYSIVVIDNDPLESARITVSTFASTAPVPVRYVVEPKSNISLARNRAVESAEGSFVAFMDDDEIPTRRWLVSLFRTLVEYGADGVLGPVEPQFDAEPPKWVVSSRIYERRPHRTGEVLDWREGRTANVLLRRAALTADVPPFRAEFLIGEDTDFFRRAIWRGQKFVWCPAALVYEVEPPERWRMNYVARKALHTGAIVPQFATFSGLQVVKSLFAVPAYAFSLPVAALLGGGKFTVVLVKLCNHAGTLLALAGLIGSAYVRE